MIGQSTPESPPEQAPVPEQEPAAAAPATREAREIGGRNGPDPTRYGDWEKNGRCIDF
jgi:hypothetical protein